MRHMSGRPPFRLPMVSTVQDAASSLHVMQAGHS